MLRHDWQKLRGPCKLGSSTGLQTPVRECLAFRGDAYADPFFPEIFTNTPAESAGKRKLFVVVSSDKGLCGGIHSSVSKYTRAAINSKDGSVDADSPVMIIGDKSKAQLSRAIPNNLAMTFNQIGRDIPTFADAASVADLIVKSGVKYDSVVIVYNKFVSAISFESHAIEVQTEVSLREARASLSFFK